MEALLSREAGGDLKPLSEADAQPLIRYPCPDAHPGDERRSGSSVLRSRRVDDPPSVLAE